MIQTQCCIKILTFQRYERNAQLDQGDFNWITPQFLALASPRHEPVAPILPSDPLYATLPTSQQALRNAEIPGPFKNVLSHCSQHNVGLVVRLNSELYSPTYFTALGINHLDMIFDDGTCPTLPMVNKFVKIAHEMITVKNKAVAVHCKAGRGRTGCLIGAYLIYRHGFTANEIIAYLRFMRPGMVMGVQQHWLHQNQGTFRSWWWEDTFKENLTTLTPTTPTKILRRRPDSINDVQTETPPDGNQHGKRSALGEINHNETSPTSNPLDDNLSTLMPGQPRKTNRIDYRHHPYSRTASATLCAEKVDKRPDEEVVGVITNTSPTSNPLDDNLSTLMPGQPRKTNRIDYRYHPYWRTAPVTLCAEKVDENPDEEFVGVITNRKNQNAANDEAESKLKTQHRQTSTRSPGSTRAIGNTMATTTGTQFSTMGEDCSDLLASNVETLRRQGRKTTGSLVLETWQRQWNHWLQAGARIPNEPKRQDRVGK